MGRREKKNWGLKLLSLVGSTSEIFFSVPGGKFAVSDHFKAGSAEVEISYIGDNFKNRFLGLVEGKSDAVCFSFYNLLKHSVDQPIIQELGGESKVVVTARLLWELLKTQNNGQSGILLTNGYSNIFYICDSFGVLCAVFVRWFGSGWVVDTYSVMDSDGWYPGYRIFSRNS